MHIDVDDIKRNSSIIEAYQRLRGEVENRLAASASRRSSRMTRGLDPNVPRQTKQIGETVLI